MNPDLFPTDFKDLADEPGWAINNKAFELSQNGDYDTAYQLYRLAQEAGYGGQELQGSIDYVRSRVSSDDVRQRIDGLFSDDIAVESEVEVVSEAIAVVQSRFPAGFEDLDGAPGWAMNNRALELVQSGDHQNAYHLYLLAEQAGYGGQELQDNLNYTRNFLGEDARMALERAVFDSRDDELSAQDAFQSRAQGTVSLPEGFEYLSGQSADVIMRIAKSEFSSTNYTESFHLAMAAEALGYEMSAVDRQRYTGYDSVSGFFERNAAYDSAQNIRASFEGASERAGETAGPVTRSAGAVREAEVRNDAQEAAQSDPESELFMMARQDDAGQWGIYEKHVTGDGTLDQDDTIHFWAQDNEGTLHQFDHDPEISQDVASALAVDWPELDEYLEGVIIPEGVADAQLRQTVIDGAHHLRDVLADSASVAKQMVLDPN